MSGEAELNVDSLIARLLEGMRENPTADHEASF